MPGACLSTGYLILKEQLSVRLTPKGRRGGAGRSRTDDICLAKAALYQLSYSPKKTLVGLGGLEPPTSRLSGVRSNQAELQAHTKTGAVSPQTCKERRNAAP